MADIQAKREQWKREQARLRNLLVQVDDKGFLENLKYIGGVDISFVKNSDRALACFSVLQFPSLKHVETYYYPCLMTEPYMPGFLGFREVDHLVEVVNMFLKEYPAARNKMLIMVDGNGILHYRRFGSASHLGVVLNIPTIGVGKELLVVDDMNADEIHYRCETELRKPGDRFELIGPRTGRVFGMAMRTWGEPIYVSVGHRISLKTSIDLVLKCCKKGNMLPEPVRLADGLSRDVIIDNPNLTKYFKDNKPILPSASSSPSPSSAAFLSLQRPPSSSHPSSKSIAHSPVPSAAVPSSPKLEKGKRKAYWECSCGAHNPIGRDACEFCYHARNGPSESSTISGSDETDSTSRDARR